MAHSSGGQGVQAQDISGLDVWKGPHPHRSGLLRVLTLQKSSLRLFQKDTDSIQAGR